MNLPQILSQADSNSYYSRSDADKLSAANSAGLQLFQAIEREHRGNFLKIDTTSIVLTPGQTIYQMPADFDSLLHMAERPNASVAWREMSPTNSIGAVTDLASQPQSALNLGYDFGGYYQSPFTFYGPYLPADQAAQSPGLPQRYSIAVAPMPDMARAVEIIYIAKWIEITDPAQAVMLPDAATQAMISLTSSILLDMDGNTDANTYRNRAMGSQQRPGEIQLLLSWARGQAKRLKRVRMFGE